MYYDNIDTIVIKGFRPKLIEISERHIMSVSMIIYIHILLENRTLKLSAESNNAQATLFVGEDIAIVEETIVAGKHWWNR